MPIGASFDHKKQSVGPAAAKPVAARAATPGRFLPPSRTPLPAGEPAAHGVIQAKAESPAAVHQAAAAPPLAHDVLRAPGQPLDAATRAFMEPRFGADFGQVRIHGDGPAAESARGIGALAYTSGAHIAFAAGRYAPATHEGRRLLAHELAHVVQQRGTAAVLRRKMDPAATTKLHDEIAEGMAIANDDEGDLKYANKDVNEGTRRKPKMVKHPEGFLATGYWEYIIKFEDGTVRGHPYNFRLKEGKSAADAIEAVFAGPTRLDCAAMMSAVMARAVLKTIGRKRFDRVFGRAGKTNQSLVIGTATPEYEFSRLANLMVDKKANSVSDLVKGDRVYFWNCWQYRQMHPRGSWNGENAIYEGDGRFSGFGASWLSEDDMKTKLWEHYNEGLKPSDQRYMTREVWEKQKNETGGPVGLDLTGTMHLDEDAVDKLGR